MSGASRRSPAAGREVAVTFDDLPAICITRGEVEAHRAITARLLEALRSHRVPAIGFVNEEKLCTAGRVDSERVDLLRDWLDAGFELGNHTYAHMDLHQSPVAAFQEDIARGERVTRGLLDARGMTMRYFRHPYLHTGTTLEAKRSVETTLAARGCRVAPVTVYNEDYLFAAAWDRAIERGDDGVARRVADAYVPYIESQFEYYEQLSRRLLGREPRQILVLHANSINAGRLDALAHMLVRRGYAFVPLERALEDDAYAVEDTYIGSEGISWLQRWALNRGLGEGFLDGEPVTPDFVRAQSGVGREGRLVRWWTRCMCMRRRWARDSRRQAEVWRPGR